MASIPEAERWARLAVLIIAALGVIALYRFLRWFRHLPLPPDPWDALIAKDWDSATATEVCHRCSEPHPAGQAFCKNCGTAIGTYNNCMPYVYIFSEGEVLRTGVAGKFQVNALTVSGFIIYSLSCYLIFAPFYWYLLLRNIRRLKAESPKPS